MTALAFDAIFEWVSVDSNCQWSRFVPTLRKLNISWSNLRKFWIILRVSYNYNKKLECFVSILLVIRYSYIVSAEM